MSIPEIVVQLREKLGKEETKRLRRNGMVPTVVYGLGIDPSATAVEPKAMATILQSEKGLNTVMNLRVEGTETTRHVMIKEVKRHPITGKLFHIDFIRIDMEQSINTVIPLAFSGSPLGVKLGGIMNIVHYEVEVTCLPKDLPGTLDVDVSELGMDEAIRVKDLPALDGVRYLLGENEVLAVVHAAEQEEASTDEEEAEEAVS